MRNGAFPFSRGGSAFNILLCRLLLLPRCHGRRIRAEFVSDRERGLEAAQVFLRNVSPLTVRAAYCLAIPNAKSGNPARYLQGVLRCQKSRQRRIQKGVIFNNMATHDSLVQQAGR